MIEAELDHDVRLHIFAHAVTEGAPPTVASTARALGAGEADVEAAFRRLAAGKVIVLVPGEREILMANPFAATPTGFAVRAGDRQWYGNCAWDALGILAAVRANGSVIAACGDCAEPLKVAVRDGAATGEAVLHIAVPAHHWWDDIVFT